MADENEAESHDAHEIPINTTQSETDQSHSDSLSDGTENRDVPLVIKRVTFERFKQFKNDTITLRPGLSLIAGVNNSGKTSLLHGLAVWEFCRIATRMERGEVGLLPESTERQGFGLGDEQFSPINLPSLKHLWTNLKSAKDSSDPDGYTLRLTCEWGNDDDPRRLGFALALVNDRLFIKTAESNLRNGDRIPAIAYLPPFAGIQSREQRINGAIRRRRIGEGLAGAVLRNLLLDMHEANVRRRAELRERPLRSSQGKTRTKISDADLKKLRQEDSWELLLYALRGVFKAELIVKDFREEYHSYIEVLVDKGDVDGYKFTRHPGYNPRDLMVEGSGFLQWLSVYTLATSPEADVLLFDEPDAHLHPALQQEMLSRLEQLTESVGKQVLLATHSVDILRNAQPSKILQLRPGRPTRYLTKDDQKIGLLEGLGSDYAPRIDQVRKTKRVLFVEGSSDLLILRTLAGVMGMEWPEQWVPWQTTMPHKERKGLWKALLEDIPGIVAVSLRDRDDEAINTVAEDLRDKSYDATDDFLCRKWRRRYIESYLLWPPTLAECTSISEQEIVAYLRDEHGIAVGSTFVNSQAPQALLDVRAKEVLDELGVRAVDVARNIPQDAVCEDIRTLLGLLSSDGS